MNCVSTVHVIYFREGYVAGNYKTAIIFFGNIFESQDASHNVTSYPKLILSLVTKQHNNIIVNSNKWITIIFLAINYVKVIWHFVCDFFSDTITLLYL